MFRHKRSLTFGLSAPPRPSGLRCAVKSIAGICWQDRGAAAIRVLIRGGTRISIAAAFAHRFPAMPAPDAKNVLAGLWRSAGHDDAALSQIQFTGAEPVLPSSFAVATAAQATIGAAALAAAELWRLAQRPPAERRRRHAPCGDRIPQRALFARRRQAAGRISRRHRRALSLRRRPLGAAAHQSAASLQRPFETARRAARQGRGAARARSA